MSWQMSVGHAFSGWRILSEEMSNAQLLHLLPEGVVAEMAEHGHLECLEVALSLGADKAAVGQGPGLGIMPRGDIPQN